MVAAAIQAQGMNAFAERYSYGPTRVQFENKDPRGFLEFKRMLAEQNGLGSVYTQRGGPARAAVSLYPRRRDELLTVPTLILTGDEDWPGLLPGILMKQSIPSAALAVVPNSGRTINIEEPDELNRIVSSFITQVDRGRWPVRDPLAIQKSITGIKD